MAAKPSAPIKNGLAKVVQTDDTPVPVLHDHRL